MFDKDRNNVISEAEFIQGCAELEARGGEEGGGGGGGGGGGEEEGGGGGGGDTVDQEEIAKQLELLDEV